jgi:hypothetical protein
MSGEELEHWLLNLSKELREMDKDWLTDIRVKLHELEVATLRTLQALELSRRL